MDLEETEWQVADLIYVQLCWSLTMVHDSLTLGVFFLHWTSSNFQLSTTFLQPAVLWCGVVSSSGDFCFINLLAPEFYI